MPRVPKKRARQTQFHLVLAELRDIRRTLHDLLHQQETLIMALNAQAQQIVDALNASTNKISAAIAAATTAIADLVKGSDDTELAAAIQPSLDALNAGAAALTKTATDADPAVNPAAPPIALPPVQG